MIRIKSFIALLGLVFTFGVVAQQVTAKDPKHAWQLIEQGALVIDVRTPGEFKQGHLPNAVNIPYHLVLAGAEQLKLDKAASVVVYCRSGRRSGIAQQTLEKAGYLQVYNGGGFELLKAAQ